MIGTINAALEATLPLQVHGPSGLLGLTVVIDTGYNGFLSLPLAMAKTLSLAALASRSVTLGDGSREVLDFYEANKDSTWGHSAL